MGDQMRHTVSHLIFSAFARFVSFLISDENRMMQLSKGNAPDAMNRTASITESVFK